ncbi:hypothetical protein QTO34_004920 [Cnephaeus nilssonii]|uniref:Epididymal-specific lipocalin-8 n=1 Tax=Cnephaeus nilssonii TaxID=3371016 RepID=A0AA40HMH2_CNENI|nr:hypothetical protein QTO34_004920 [Eptesicus nilssonii]
MGARLLGAILGLVLVQVEVAVQDLDLQKIAGFWREVGVASNQNLALKTPKRPEALFLTLSGGELTVKAAYNRKGVGFREGGSLVTEPGGTGGRGLRPVLPEDAPPPPAQCAQQEMKPGFS